MGIARAVGAILFSIVIGLLMHFIFRREELEKANAQLAMPEPEVDRPLWQEVLYFAAMVGILVFANWGRPQESVGLWHAIFAGKWLVTAGFAVALAVILASWFNVCMVETHHHRRTGRRIRDHRAGESHGSVHHRYHRAINNYDNRHGEKPAHGSIPPGDSRNRYCRSCFSGCL